MIHQGEAMKPLRVYLDASAFGGPFDPEFSAPSEKLFERFSQGALALLVSDTLIGEIADAPEEVQDLLDRTMRAGVEHVPLTQEAIALRQAYLKARVVTPKYADDALHVAQATIARADVIASWNFRHLVNPLRVRAFNGVNVAHGYGIVVILTPEDVIKTLEMRNESR